MPVLDDADADATAAIEAHIARGDEARAYGLLCAILAWPRGKQIIAAELPQLLDLFARLSAQRGADALAELAADVVRDPDSPDKLYDLGYALIDAGAPTIAASVLWRCLALVGDSEEVVCELVSALESALAYGDAFEILERHPGLRARSFLCQYLYAFNAAMSGNLTIVRATLPGLAADSPDTAAMAGTIASIVERADRVAGATPLDRGDLRGWHYVLTGTLLTHQSPHGFEEPMHGRFAFVQDSIARIATGLDRLGALIAGLDIPCIYAAPGRGSEILGQAAEQRLGIPRAPWPAIGVPAPGLVIVYDLAELPPGDIARLVQRRESQILFAHATPWPIDSPIAPELTTLLYQTLAAPWAETVTVDATGLLAQSPGDARSIEAIAAEIAASPGLPAEELAADQPERWAALVARAWPPTPGARSRSWGGGPVPSSRFA